MTRIHRILCPTDFSESSRHAVALTVGLARWHHASVMALHVWTPMFMPIPGLPVPDQRISDVVRKSAHDRVETSFSEAGGASIDVEVVVEVGHAANRILEAAARLPADLLVMGTHGASGFEHLVLGSVTEKVLRKAPCAVLTVPPRAEAPLQLPFRHIVCAVDFSDWSLAAVDLAIAWAGESGAALTTVHVIEWPWQEPPSPSVDGVPPIEFAALMEYRRYLEARALARLEGLVPDAIRIPNTARVSHGRPYVEILRLAEEEQADLIVLGVHSRHAVDIGLLGSSTNQIVRRATCPVLTLRR